MNLRLVVRIATAVLALAMLAIPAQAAAKSKSKKPLVVCKHGCKYKTVQSAADKAKKNGKIYVLKGKYVEGVVIEGHKYDNLTIQGMIKKKKKTKNGKTKVTYKKADPKKVILEGKNAKTPDGSTANNGIEGIDINGLTVKNMWARNYGANGFFVHDSDPRAADNTIECNDYLFKNDIASYNRAYGFYAFGCAGGRFTKSTGYGHGDSAFYVGATPPQSNPKTTKIDHVDAYENVLGFSGTNSRYMLIEDSNWFNNGVGIVPNTLDSEPFEPNSDGVIKNNDIYWNNFNYFLPNSKVATVSDGLGQLDDLTIQYPTGVGIVLLGSQGWTAENNNIFGNWKWGAAVVSDPFNDGDDAISKNNQFLNNKMGKGGADLNAVDFFNQGSGTGNCFSGNTSSTFDPSDTAPTSELYPACPPSDVVNAGQTGTSFGDPTQFGDLAAYITQDPPAKQECSWTKTPHDAPYEGNEPLELTPGPTC
ncbi:MAG: right-handed parallel beta-helix repeat-containing protein [Solirubrobacterales bacterium]|nr:right-handed parallel beta-helix repeat-containing protein [Solirubrobacterales bacterium]MCO5326867.1 right-handed parallel beta-helix repeat-containing protein [Solirubrobacterales bacterium]